MNSAIHMVLQDSFKSLRIKATKSEELSQEERAIMFATGLDALLNKVIQLKEFLVTTDLS